MSFPIPHARVAALIGCRVQQVEANWPPIMAAFEMRRIWTNLVGVAALATVRVECPPFRPIREYGSTEYLNRMYDARTDLGNTPEKDGDGARYCGRGYIQITGRSNYRLFGMILGVDLEGQPDLALDSKIAAEIFAAYFSLRNVHVAANARDWRRVRRLVNGGANGMADFLKYVERLEAVLNEPGPEAVDS